MITTQIELAKIAIKLDQPLKAIEIFQSGMKKFPFETHLITGIARIHDLLNDPGKAVTFYKKILVFDN